QKRGRPANPGQSISSGWARAKVLESGAAVALRSGVPSQALPDSAQSVLHPWAMSWLRDAQSQASSVHSQAQESEEAFAGDCFRFGPAAEFRSGLHACELRTSGLLSNAGPQVWECLRRTRFVPASRKSKEDPAPVPRRSGTALPVFLRSHEARYPQVPPAA